MKKITVDVTCPKVSDTWKLSVSKDCPETLKEWVEYHGSEVPIRTALERFYTIRAQDLGRRLKAGGKNSAPATDQTIIQAVRAFKFGVSISVVHAPSKEMATNAIKTLPDDELLATIAELQREHAKRLKEEAEKANTENPTA